MITFQDQYEELQRKTGDYSTARLLVFKQDLNVAGARLLNMYARKQNREYRTTSLVEDQQYYQKPFDVLRVSRVRILISSTWYPLKLITSEDDWDALNQTEQSSSVPEFFFIRGDSEIGIWPIPPANVTNGMEIGYEPQHVDLSAEDYITGTVAVTNGSVTVTHSGTGFTAAMVGRFIQFGGGGKYYRIGGYTSTSVVTLENYYEGVTAGASAFRIGEVMKIPNGYQKAPTAYALREYYAEKENLKMTSLYGGEWKDLIKELKSTYGRSTSKMGTDKRPLKHRASNNWIDRQPPVTYPPV